MALTFVSGDPLGRNIRDGAGGFVDGPDENVAITMNEIGVEANKPDKLMFPMDLQNEQFYPEAIKFTIYQRYGKGLEKIEPVFVGSISEEVTLQTDRIDLEKKIETDTAAAQKLENLGITPSNKQRTIFSDKIRLNALQDRNIPQSTFEVLKKTANAVGGVLKDKQAARQGRIDGGTSAIKQSIYLQMPESIIFNEQVDWTGTDLGVVGAMIKGEGITGAGIAAGIGNAGKVLGGSLGALAGMLPGLSGPASAIVGALVGGESGLAGGIESTISMKANPFKEQTFQGVPFRPFEFQFVFRARSSEEVTVIRQIIQAFRSYSKPSFKDGGSTVFKYPHEFRIEFLRLVNDNYETNDNLPQIKYCICKTVNTNYTGQGWKSFEGGAPVDINLTLSFEETEIITQEDVDGQTAVGDFKERKYKF